MVNKMWFFIFEYQYRGTIMAFGYIDWAKMGVKGNIFLIAYGCWEEYYRASFSQH